MTISDQTDATTAPTRPSGPAGARRWLRRTLTLLTTLVAAAGLSLAGSTAAHADADGTPFCVHGVFGKTTLSTNLPLNDPGTTGAARNQWLYRWNGNSWAYTGYSSGARSYPGGIWMSGGHMVYSVGFTMAAGSGYYIVRDQVISPTGQSVVFNEPYYLDSPSYVYRTWCQA